MKKTFKQIVRQYLSFSRSDRNAIIILISLILMILFAKIIVLNLDPEPITDRSEFDRVFEELGKNEMEKSISEQMLFIFDPNKITDEKLDSLLIPDSIKRNLIAYRKAGGKFSTSDDLQKLYGMNDSIFKAVRPYINIRKENKSVKVTENKQEIKITGHFDPNKTTYNELKRFGFNDFQAKNLLNYKNKGGVFTTAEDLRKIYGIDSAFYTIIENHVQIEKIIVETDSDKEFEPLKVELNSTDSAQLVKLRGIGPAYANRILKYRELLGGFYTKRQLLEVYNFPEETYQNIEASIVVDTILVKKIRINFAEYKDLLKHPYLNKEQVEAILMYRENNGSFKNVSSIGLVKGITKETSLKMNPYFTCR